MDRSLKQRRPRCRKEVMEEFQSISGPHCMGSARSEEAAASRRLSDADGTIIAMDKNSAKVGINRVSSVNIQT